MGHRDVEKGTFFGRVYCTAVFCSKMCCLEACWNTLQGRVHYPNSETPPWPGQMIWGAMSFRGTAGLYFLPPETTMNGEKYVHLLKSKLELNMRVHNRNIFMHDGTPCHRSEVVKNFLEQERIQRLEWPRNSPDLNPIENLWNFTKKKVSEKHSSRLDALQTAVK